MALDHYPQSVAWERLQTVSNIIFTVIYALEMILKMIALGPWGYLSDPYNDLDGFLVVTSYVEQSPSLRIAAVRLFFCFLCLFAL